jgi:hypothetical protein
MANPREISPMNDMTMERNPTTELERNIALLKSHGQAIERLKFLEAELAQLEADERNEFERYASGGPVRVPVFDLDQRKVQKAIAEIAATFAKWRSGS